MAEKLELGHTSILGQVIKTKKDTSKVWISFACRVWVHDLISMFWCKVLIHVRKPQRLILSQRNQVRFTDFQLVGTGFQFGSCAKSEPLGLPQHGSENNFACMKVIYFKHESELRCRGHTFLEGRFWWKDKGANTLNFCCSIKSLCLILWFFSCSTTSPSQHNHNPRSRQGSLYLSYCI